MQLAKLGLNLVCLILKPGHLHCPFGSQDAMPTFRQATSALIQAWAEVSLLNHEPLQEALWTEPRSPPRGTKYPFHPRKCFGQQSKYASRIFHIVMVILC